MLLGADPQMPIAIFAQGGHPGQDIRGGIVGGNAREFDTIEAHQPGAGADPQKTIVRLDDGGNRLRWQTIRRVPCAHGGGGLREIRIEIIRPTRERNETSQTSDQTNVNSFCQF